MPSRRCGKRAHRRMTSRRSARGSWRRPCADDASRHKRLMLLSVIMPTIDGRPLELGRTMDAYERLTPVPIEWHVLHNYPNCGVAWNVGAAIATGDILHMGADDIEPVSDAWFPAALAAIERGMVPLGWVNEPSGAGTFGRDFPRVVICRREWWRDVPEIHYWSDNAFGDLMV